MNVQINEINDIKNEEIKLEKETIYKKLHVDSDIELINEKDPYIKNKLENIEETKENNNIINNNKNNDNNNIIYNKNNVNKDFRKACTCVGYIYFSKKS